MHHRLSENDMAARPRLSLEDGSSSFAALFGGNAQQRNFSGSLARRDSGSSLVSSRLDDLGLNLDLPGLQVSSSCCQDAHHTSSSCVMVMQRYICARRTCLLSIFKVILVFIEIPQSAGGIQ